MLSSWNESLSSESCGAAGGQPISPHWQIELSQDTKPEKQQLQLFYPARLRYRLQQLAWGNKYMTSILCDTIPSSVCNLSSLIFLPVAFNQLHGRLPPDLGLTLPNLGFLQIHNNFFFRGPIPETLSSALNITCLDVIQQLASLGKSPR